MEKYDYLSAVESDVREYIENNVNFHDYSDLDEMKEDLNEKLFVEDSITGNASGSYTFNTWKAEEYLCHNLDLLAEANEEFGGSSDILSDGAETCDVTIRCYFAFSGYRKCCTRYVAGLGRLARRERRRRE